MIRTTFAALVIVSAGPATAGIITPSAATLASGTLDGGGATTIIDGSTPSEGTYWQTDTAWWHGTEGALQVDLGGRYRLDDLIVSVDNNDNYQVSYSLDGTSFSTLFDISYTYGNVGDGMDTMSTDSASPYYVAAIDFVSVDARFLRIAAIDGDDAYSVGEITAYGSPAVAPIAPPLLLLLTGLATIARQRVKPISTAAQRTI